MALEDLTGATKYLNALVPTNPDPLDAKSQGDDHIRGIKNVLLNTFGSVAAPVDVINTAKKNANETITGAWTFSNQLGLFKASGDLLMPFNNSTPGTGKNYYWINQGAGNFVLYDQTSNRTVLAAIGATGEMQCLNKNGSLARVCAHPLQISCGTRAFNFGDIGNVLRNDGGATFTLGPATAAGDFLRINNYAGTLTIARGTQELVWLRGGSLASGADRIVAPYSSIDLVYTSSNQWTITGNGIS